MRRAGPRGRTWRGAQGVADKELSALLFTDRVIPVAHGTTFDALREVSPLLAGRSGLTIGGLADQVHTAHRDRAV